LKYLGVYKNRINCETAEEVFDYLKKTMKESITGWDYFVNWSKINGFINNIEIDLNLLNYLIGKNNIEEELSFLLLKYPHVYNLIPILLACRDNKFNILQNFGYNNFDYEFYDFSKKCDFTKEDIKKAVDFAKNSGFLDLLKNKSIKNVVDYILGVEVGLDSNARKNRSGTSMETIIDFFVKDICSRNKYNYLKQANTKNIFNEFKIKLLVDKSSRCLDFAVNTGKNLYLIETNFYGGGGSKLKSTAGEYITMYEYWKSQGFKFIWITDGLGWQSAYLPLNETFNKIDCILNINMIENHLLEDIITGELL